MTTRHCTLATVRRSALLTALLLASPMIATAHQASDTSGTRAAAMTDMHSLTGIDHGPPEMALPVVLAAAAKSVPAKTRQKNAVVAPVSSMGTMHGMSCSDPAAATGMSHQAAPAMSHESTLQMDSMAGNPMGPMQGGRAPAGARSADYSDGQTYGSLGRPTMHGSAPLGMLLLDQLEMFDGKSGSGQAWEAQGWYGNDVNKWWFRTEGDRSGGKIEDGDVELFWNRNVATFWSTQLGVRHDLREGPKRNWAAFGLQGLAPYWVELEATGYVGDSGRTAARLRVEYELLFTQRLVLQPELEVNIYGKSDPARGIGSGVSDAQLGMRLRYEIRRQFAPYVGVVWTRRFGATADFARDDHRVVFDRQWVAGVRIWF